MIDWDRVAELRSEVGTDDFAEIVTLFVEEVRSVLGPIREGYEPDDPAEVLHFLKGCAANLGFVTLAQTCVANDQSSQAGAPLKWANVLLSYDNDLAEFLSTLADDHPNQPCK